jgi:hypothetical protein
MDAVTYNSQSSRTMRKRTFPLRHVGVGFRSLLKWRRSLTRSVGRSTRDNRRDRVDCVETPVCFENEVFVILVARH